MLLLLSGGVTFIITVALFVYCLPRDGKMHRFVGTELEPYIAVAFCSGLALSFTMILSSILDMLGTIQP
jgi:hypothetical protein